MYISTSRVPASCCSSTVSIAPVVALGVAPLRSDCRRSLESATLNSPVSATLLIRVIIPNERELCVWSPIQRLTPWPPLHRMVKGNRRSPRHRRAEGPAAPHRQPPIGGAMGYNNSVAIVVRWGHAKNTPCFPPDDRRVGSPLSAST